MAEKRYQIESVLRAVDILEFLAQNGGSSRVTDIASAAHCSKNTAFRILKTFELRGYVRQATDSSYELTLKLLDLGESVASSMDLHDVARPYLEETAREFGETATLGVLDGLDVIYLDRVLGSVPYHTTFSVGSRAHSYSTSLGKAILAFSSEEVVELIVGAGLAPITEATITDPARLVADLRETRERGYAIDNQENVLGIRCVGAPLFGRKGVVIGAVSVSGLAVRFTDEVVECIAKSLLSKTAAISDRMGYRMA